MATGKKKYGYGILSVTEEVDPFEDQWSVPGPPPAHSPPSTFGQELVQRQQRQQMEDVDAVKEGSGEDLGTELLPIQKVMTLYTLGPH